MFDRLLGGLTRISRLATWVGGAVMMITAVIVTFDVLARKFAGFSLEGADELSGYAFAVATSWALAYGLLQRANVRIDGLYLAAPVPLRAFMDIVALVTLGIYLVALLYSGWILWSDSYQFDSRSITAWRTKLAIPQGLWLLGWLWLTAVLAVVLLRCFIAVLQGRPNEVVAVAGVLTMEEEVAAEVRHAAEEVAHERRQDAGPRGAR
jgi:TRAP-type C4-dicarboxylate transport system permease small subunit